MLNKINYNNTFSDKSELAIIESEAYLLKWEVRNIIYDIQEIGGKNVVKSNHFGPSFNTTQIDFNKG